MTAAAHCRRCPWTAAGPWPDTDRAAAAHTRKGHPTTTIAAPPAGKALNP